MKDVLTNLIVVNISQCLCVSNHHVEKNEMMPFAVTWVDLEIVILSEVSQTERQISYDVAYMWNLKNGTNEPI